MKTNKPTHREQLEDKIYKVYEALRDLSEVVLEQEDFNTIISTHVITTPFDKSLDEAVEDWYTFWAEMTELL